MLRTERAYVKIIAKLWNEERSDLSFRASRGTFAELEMTSTVVIFEVRCVT